MNMNIKDFLKCDIDLECETSKKWRPLHFALKYNPTATRELLCYEIDLECKTLNGWKPIHFALKYNTTEIIGLLICRGINISHIDLTQKGHDLMYFVLSYSKNIIELLNKMKLVYPRKTDIFTPDILHLLSIYNHTLYLTVMQIKN